MPKQKPRPRLGHSEVPADLPQRLEATRLELLALFRATDSLLLFQDIPEELHGLFELDADLAEALWALDQPAGGLDFGAMTRDTRASLNALPAARDDLMALLDESERHLLDERAGTIRGDLPPRDAYLQIPGRDPMLS